MLLAYIICMKKKQKGMTLEGIINKTNIGYRKKNLALIVKKSTPIQLTEKGLKYTVSTVDYSGVYKNKDGLSIAVSFDAKETKSKTSFPLINIEDHQVEFLSLWSSVGGEAFILIYFLELDKSYKVPIEFILNFKKNENRKSIPIDKFDEQWLVKLEDYLNINV